jgi:hypothetical protein
MIPVIDVEASSLSENSYPIEVGVYIPIGNEVLEYEWLIKPEKEWLDDREWNEQSSKVHNISLDKLKNEGVSGYTVCQKLNALLLGQTIYSDAPEFDEMWLKVMFDYWNIEMHFFIEYILYPEDVKLRKRIYNKDISHVDFKNMKEKELSKHGMESHRALNDAKAMGLVMKRLLK